MFKIGCFRKRGIENNLINYDELKQKSKEGAVIIDVRSPQEYKEGHIQNSILIPEYEIKRKITKAVENKNQEIIVYCSSGGRSHKAYESLKRMGYSNVYELKNGLDGIDN